MLKGQVTDLDPFLLGKVSSVFTYLQQAIRDYVSQFYAALWCRTPIGFQQPPRIHRMTQCRSYSLPPGRYAAYHFTEQSR